MQRSPLSYEDVIAMTDEGNTLLITSGGGDTLNLTGFLANTYSKQNTIELDTLVVDDATNTTDGTTVNNDFDVYVAGDVTLIIEDSGSIVNVA